MAEPDPGAGGCASARSGRARSVHRRRRGWLSQLGGIAAVGLLLAAVLVICQMVFVRYVLQGSAIWQHEFVTFSLIGATFIGAPYVLLTHGHVNVDLLPVYLGAARPLRARPAGRADLAGLLRSSLAGYGFAFWYQSYIKTGTPRPSGGRRCGCPTSPFPLGMGLLSLQYVAEILALVTGRAGSVRRRGGTAVSELQLGLLVAAVTDRRAADRRTRRVLPSASSRWAFWSGPRGCTRSASCPTSSTASLDSFALLSIPMFILMGGAIASSRAGADLYEALERWLYRVPGGLLASNLGACAIFAALCGLVARDLRRDRQDGRAGDAQARLSRRASPPARSAPAARSAS